MAAYFYYAPLMILLCADASDDASVHSDCIVPQSFPINRPFLIHFNVHTLKINKNSYFYSVSRILYFDVIFLGVLQHEELCQIIASTHFSLVAGIRCWSNLEENDEETPSNLTLI